MALATTTLKTPGLANTGVFLFIGLLAVCVTGCATSNLYQKQSSYADYPALFYIQGVPFFPQEEFQCGPSVLAGVLNFFGYKIVPEDVSGAIYLDSIEGTLKMDMVNYAKRYEDGGRIHVSEVQGDIELIKKDVSEGHPIIVFVDLGIWEFRKGHYMLIVGYDDNQGGIIVYSGVKRDKLITYNRFLKMWKRGGYWALRVIPD